jgi:hypothetical protein
MKKRNTRQLDALLALPLDRFRRTISRLADDELRALGERLEVQLVKNRWARGGHGFARHRAGQELVLLKRRQEELRRETADRPCRAYQPDVRDAETEAPERAA